MAGKPGSSNSDPDYEEVLDWGNDFERWCRVIEGYSMADVFLPGDRPIFENRKFETGDVVHAEKDGEECVKAIRSTPEGMMLYSFNEDYDPFPAEGWVAKGVCVGRIRYKAFGIREIIDFPYGLKWNMRREDL